MCKLNEIDQNFSADFDAIPGFNAILFILCILIMTYVRVRLFKVAKLETITSMMTTKSTTELKISEFEIVRGL